MDNLQFPLIPQVEQVLDLLNQSGYEAWIVGGCVRDFLLGEPPKDYDLTTNARPEEIVRVFSAYSVFKTGIQHGTVTVMFEGTPFEVTTYRVDRGYSDGRHPDGVVFTRSLREDAARRDFTINAMAYHPTEGLRDYFGGREDLERKILRCVGEPKRRFQEDALRILRGLRFASALGFSVEEETRKALFDCAPLLERISAERVGAEVCKLVCGKGAGKILRDYMEVLAVNLPELAPMKGFQQHSRYHCWDVLTHTAAALEHTLPDLPVRLAVLLHDVGKPETFSLDGAGEGHFYGHARASAALAEDMLRRLRVSNAIRETVVLLVKYHDLPLEADPKFLQRWLGRLGEENFFRLLAVQRADNWGQAPQYRDRQAWYDTIETAAQGILTKGACLCRGDLVINGRDLLEAGYRGKAIGETMERVLTAVIQGELENRRESILQFLDKNNAEK